MNIIDVLNEMKGATGLSYRVLWKSKGPKNTAIAEHGSAALFTPMGQPAGILYVQVFAKGHGFEVFLGATGSTTKTETWAWIKKHVIPNVPPVAAADPNKHLCADGAAARVAIADATAHARRNQVSMDIRHDTVGRFYYADLRAPLNPGHKRYATVHCDGRVGRGVCR